VTDQRSGLIWQRDLPASFDRCTGKRNLSGDACNAEEAKHYCATLSIAGLSWRVPSKAELESIIDDTQFSPSIDPDAFPNTDAYGFWTSSPVAGSNSNARWYVDFAEGAIGNANPRFAYLVRCVHSN
jgi:hypothetical protein